jgi:hypothetical protein
MDVNWKSKYPEIGHCEKLKLCSVISNAKSKQFRKIDDSK